MIITIYNNGQRHFGENYIQELVDKSNDSEVIILIYLGLMVFFFTIVGSPWWSLFGTFCSSNRDKLPCFRLNETTKFCLSLHKTPIILKIMKMFENVSAVFRPHCVFQKSVISNRTVSSIQCVTWLQGFKETNSLKIKCAPCINTAIWLFNIYFRYWISVRKSNGTLLGICREIKLINLFLSLACLLLKLLTLRN